MAALEQTPAETVSTELPTTASTLPDYYVSLGTSFGADDAVDWLYGAASVDVGTRVADSFWIRGRFQESARVGWGALNQGPTIHEPQRPYSEELVGLEWRGCSSRAFCVASGLDTGYRSADQGRSGGGLAFIPRIGLDVGSEHLRFRPTLETSVAWLSGFDTELGILPALGLGLNLAVASQW